MSTLRVDSIRGQTADGVAKYVVQVVQGTFDSTASTSSHNTMVDTGLTVNITPTSASNKIHVHCNLSHAGAASNASLFKIMRSINGGSYADVTDWIGDADGSRIRSMTGSMVDYDSYRNAPMAIYAVDDSHNTTNPITGNSSTLYADTSNQQSDYSTNIDFLSNGFKPRTDGGHINATNTYIYMAFAETPSAFTNSR